MGAKRSRSHWVVNSVQLAVKSEQLAVSSGYTPGGLIEVKASGQRTVSSEE